MGWFESWADELWTGLNVIAFTLPLLAARSTYENQRERLAVWEEYGRRIPRLALWLPALTTLIVLYGLCAVVYYFTGFPAWFRWILG
ncbi:hypothetical protein KHC23_07625 [Ancylobacter dichloromethanicus]|uniref:Uncharacterized protein n=1 Tax=Ancylobacter dichloromethanicus TaxID=518825 RepID=A0A9W6JA85_9HYPH|nr:hypothetical protein [Ancylobacter dichloromethanicus]MBS7553515.1 hypothetical protein [Ancylobacter dichloromethanicus]GLK72573.1 hypothetical protein GCM10017643_26890 [Ancylobacter dichloromethanicus]